MNKYNHQYFDERDHLDLLIADSLTFFLQQKKLKSVIDVGCGTGRLVKYLNKRGIKTVGCDNAKEAIKKARKINRSQLIIRASATNIPLSNNSFDLVSAISVIEHLSSRDAEKFLSESKRILKNNGYIFIVTPNFNSPLRYLLRKQWFAYSDPTHIDFFTPKSISSLLRNNGFKNITFSFAVPPNVQYDLHLPAQLRILPKPVKSLINYLLFTSPLCLFRDSFWVSAQNNGK